MNFLFLFLVIIIWFDLNDSSNYLLFPLDPSYVISPYNALCSDDGDQAITTFDECTVAATKLHFDAPIIENLDAYPRGCYIHGKQSVRIHFNSHSTGSAYETSRQICKSTGN